MKWTYYDVHGNRRTAEEASLPNQVQFVAAMTDDHPHRPSLAELRARTPPGSNVGDTAMLILRRWFDICASARASEICDKARPALTTIASDPTRYGRVFEVGTTNVEAMVGNLERLLAEHPADPAVCSLDELVTYLRGAPVAAYIVQDVVERALIESGSL
jgi:hypothetical protein